MASNDKVRVAIVGLGFGAEFIPIYQAYPHAEMYAICRRSQKDLNECGDRWKVATRYTDFNTLIQFPRGSHQQEMAGWPGYWEGLPPMHYATHCISPCLALPGKLAEHVVCHGSGKISEKLTSKYGSPFAIETATMKLADSNLAAE